ncbi:MAG TPA: sigma 54-interacting transcriptional regulator [Polyangiales bacterium]
MTDRTSDPLLSSTLRSHQPHSPARRVTLPCLTVVAHPHPSLVGARAVLKGLLVGQSIEISRVQPLFAHPGGSDAQPIADRHISRTPVRIEPGAGGALWLDATQAPVTLDGTVVNDRRVIDPASLERGVTLGLADRVLLLLHRTTNRPLTELPGLLGQSDAIEDVRRDIQRVADLEASVLVRGETGVGKELVALAIHKASRRAAAEFVAINMATLPESVAAATLFGHARGAFTGAAARHRGVFERAAGGTLLLDELGETPQNVQPMLLRAIETKSILPLGDEQERKLDLRLIAATDADLEREQQEGTFSGALLHRLAGYEIDVPALRDRQEDIAILFTHFVRDELAAVEPVRAESEELGMALPISLVARLLRHPLPGNVRQLANIARHLVISNRGEQGLSMTEAVERKLASQVVQSAVQLTPTAGAQTLPPPPRRNAGVDEAALLRALEDHQWSPGRAATALGIPTGTLHDLMRRTGVARRAADLSDEELREAFEACGGDLASMSQRLRVSERGLQLTLRLRRMG